MTDQVPEASRTAPATEAVGSPLERGVRWLVDEGTNACTLIHISWAGPEYWIAVGDKIMRFEDHHYCGPIVLSNKSGDPMGNQPGEKDKFWLHYDAWAKSGKKTKPLEGKAWCDYKTELQAWRRSIANSKPPNVKLSGHQRPSQE